MPTGKWMFGVRRAQGVFVAAVVAVALAPAAATASTTTSSAPPTTVPISTGPTVPGSTAPGTTVPGPTTTTTLPPLLPRFTLPTDYGLQLMQQMDQAKAALASAKKQMPRAQAAFAKARRHDSDVKHQLKRLNAKERDTARRLDTTRENLREAATTAYIHAGSGQLMAAVSSFLNSNSAVDVGSQLHVISSYGDSELNTLQEYLALKKSVEHQVAVISDLSDRSSRALHAAQQRVSDLHLQTVTAQKQIEASTLGIVQFQEAATSALSPILGPSRLTAKQMADYIVANGYKPNITVPIQELAQDYLDEGVKTGVRGDVAFAQSILETGGFANPGSAATDNNFAGIGWCDTCAHGYNFPDARTGVRAQLQLLRIYVDPNFPTPAYKEPILLPGTLSLGFRGKVQTWWDLWHTWATGALYGQRVYDIYEKMVAFAQFDATPATPSSPATVPGGKAPPPPTSNDVTRPPGSGPGTKKP